jgi:hypothetical protein
MTRQESERKLNELRKKYIALISSMNFAKAQKIKNKIDSLEREVEPHSLGELLQDYTPEFKVEMLRKMHKLFIYSDLLEGAALEFQSELESNGIDAQVVFQVKRVLKELRSIERIPDEESSNMKQIKTVNLIRDLPFWLWGTEKMFLCFLWIELNSRNF